MINIAKLEKSKKYLIALSGGPDSMALVNLVKNYNVVCAHVNYNARPMSINDETVVRKYCQTNNIELIINNVSEEFVGNFQEQARIYRYEWFARLCKEHGCDEVLVAHHADDSIETYLMQKTRGGSFGYIGLKELTLIFETVIRRPLLSVFKDELILYLNNNNIEYAVDPSNETDIYERNRVRIKNSRLSLEEKNIIVDEILEANVLNEKLNEECVVEYAKYINGKTIDNLLYNVNMKVLDRVIFRYLSNTGYPVKKIRNNIISEIKMFIAKTIKQNATMDLPGEYVFVKNMNVSYLERK